MKIVRAVLVLVLFILAVLLASANERSIELVYLPELPLAGFERARSVMLPTFLLVLISLGLGGVLGGGLALFQQASLKFRLRKAEKDSARLANDVAAAREKLGLVTAQLDEARREAAELRTELEGPLGPADPADVDPNASDVASEAGAYDDPPAAGAPEDDAAPGPSQPEPERPRGARGDGDPD